MWPALGVFLDGKPCRTLPAPADVAPRAWLLGVAAVQARIEEGKPTAQLRVHSTGSEDAFILPLHRTSIVQAGLGDFQLPRITPPELDGEELARLSVFVGEKAMADARLTRASLQPNLRAFGHVFCRWLRDGGHEAGCDLTDFLARQEGAMFERKLVHPISREVVSYVLTLRH
jgi:hypothetical protein